MNPDINQMLTASFLGYLLYFSFLFILDKKSVSINVSQAIRWTSQPGVPSFRLSNQQIIVCIHSIDSLLEYINHTPLP